MFGSDLFYFFVIWLDLLVLDAQEAQLMAGRSFKVGGEEMSFYRVLSIEQRSAGDDIFQSAKVYKVWPPRAV